jgi:nucleotide-sensitive chloride channel 1A
VTPLFDALSACSALHASLLPSGEPSNFFGFADDDDDDDEWEDDQFDDADEPAGGRVRSDFHSGGGPGARFQPY